MLRITNDRLTLLKLLAVASMVIDHYNKFSNPEYSQIMFSVGRIALPIFVFVLAFNLSRIEADKMPTIAARLVFFGLLATPAYNSMGGTILGDWWPLNVLFLLAGLVGVVYLVTVPVARRLRLYGYRALAVLLFVFVGALAEFFWVGLGLGLVAWRVFVLFSRGENTGDKGRGEIALLSLAAAVLTALLCLINGNGWALAAIPVVLAVLWFPVVKLPRFKWFFYWFYPAHLCALWLIDKV
jgi:hypothetical protein